MRADLNCDLGESFGAYVMGNDRDLLPLVTSVNIACGFHAGDPQVMRHTVQLAKAHGVSIGAHPGFRDLVGFGRRELHCSEDELYCDILYQIGALAAVCRAEDVPLRHVKPHGALYNMASREAGMAQAIVAAIADFNRHLILYCPPHSALAAAAAAAGVPVAAEAFVDRRYNADGSLVSRHDPGSVLTDPTDAAAQALGLVCGGEVTAVSGETVPLRADTLCIHGDNPSAVAIAQHVRAALLANDVALGPPQ